VIEEVTMAVLALALWLAIGAAAVVVLRRKGHNDPADVLSRCAAEEGYELVVVPGCDGHRWRRVLTGDVIHRLPATTPVPVLVGPAAR
jgi:hypothetical protein